MFYFNGFYVLGTILGLFIPAFIFIDSLTIIFFLVVLLMLIIIGFKVLVSETAYSVSWLGKDLGIVKQSGFYWFIPFCQFKSASLKLKTCTTEKIRAFDASNIEIEVSISLVYQINNVSNVLKNVENYEEYLKLSVQSVLHAMLEEYSFIESKEYSSLLSQKLLNYTNEKIKNIGIKIIDASFFNLSVISSQNKNKDNNDKIGNIVDKIDEISSNLIRLENDFFVLETDIVEIKDNYQMRKISLKNEIEKHDELMKQVQKMIKTKIEDKEIILNDMGRIISNLKLLHDEYSNFKMKFLVIENKLNHQLERKEVEEIVDKKYYESQQQENELIHNKILRYLEKFQQDFIDLNEAVYILEEKIKNINEEGDDEIHKFKGIKPVTSVKKKRI